MKNKLLLIILLLISITVYSQGKSLVSDLDELKINIGQVFKPTTYSIDNLGEKFDCERVIYYQKRGAFSKGNSIEFDRIEGTLKGIEPGYHEIIAICYSGGSSSRRTFNVKVNYPKVKSINILTGKNTIYTNTFIPISYEITDEMGVIRNIDYWKSDNAQKYFSNLEFSINSSNNKLDVDESNNVFALKSGSATINVVFDGIKSSKNITIKKNPVTNIDLNFEKQKEIRTGDVLDFDAIAYDKKGNIIDGLDIDFSFKGKSFDKSNSASGLILQDGRFVGDVAGKYIITASFGKISKSKVLNVFERNIKREIKKIGAGSVNDRHTSDFWVFEGVDKKDYAVTGTWGSDGTAYFWDVTNPSNIKKIDSVQVDARTVNDVKVSPDGKICIISREGASNRKNGIIIIDVSNPSDVKIISEYTKNLTGGVHNLFIDEKYVYALSGGQKYYILDIADPKNPKEVGMFEIGKNGQAIHDVWVENGIAYSSNWRDGVYLVDVGNGIAGGSPTNPVAFGNYTYDSGANHATFPFKSKSTGKFYAVMGDEIFPNGVNPNGTNETAGFLHFVDFSDLKNPVEIARYELPGHGSHNYWIEDDILYVGMYTGGVRIIDISGDLVGDLYKQGREIAYLLTGTSDGYIPNDTMVWGAQLYKGHVFYSDFNSGIGVAKVSKIKPDPSMENQYVD
tara:strand:- start:169 stop:2205 length:2037 start_codon:yes stop_codon:yes gene_type:complete